MAVDSLQMESLDFHLRAFFIEKSCLICTREPLKGPLFKV